MTKSAVKRAAEEHTDLSVFSAIISILEGGSLYGHGRAAQKIIDICKRETSCCLYAYDKYATKAGAKDEEI